MTKGQSHVLRVADEQHVVDTARSALISSSLDLSVAGGVHEGRAHAEAARPDVVVSAWTLPDGNADDLTAMIEEDLGIPLVMLVDADVDQTVAAMRAGAVDCVVHSARMWQEFPERVAQSLGMWRSTVEHRRNVRTLHESAETHGRLLETMNEGLAIIDENGHIAFANKRLCVALGYGRPELLGRDTAELLSDDQAVLLSTQKALWEEGDGEPFEMEWTCRDERKLPVLASPSPIMDDRGKYHGGLVVFTDLTQVKQLQKQISRAEKMESLGRLAGGVAHDLNNTLSGIVSYPDLLLLDMDEDNRMCRPLRAIKESGLRAAGIVEDLLTLTRRAVDLQEIVNLNGLVDLYLGSAEFTRMQARHEAVTVVRDMEPDLLNVRGSSLHLSKVLMNLLANAMEAMPAGGTVTISARNE